MSTFNIDRLLLSDILKDIETGKIQLPDFQRGWIWDDYRIRSLLASVSQAFPIGAVLTLAADGNNFRFKPRFIEGVTPADDKEEPSRLILDGQQRLTALFQSLISEQGVYTLNTRGIEIHRYYYLDIEKCLGSEIDREEAVLSCREHRRVQKPGEEIIDLSSSEMEYANAMFPVNKIFNSDDWGDEYKIHWHKNPSKRKLFNRFNREVIERFKLYSLPVIHLRGDTPREAVCLVFEKVNTRGVTLTVFELLTASFAIDDFQLREDWDKRSKRLKEYPILEDLDAIHFLRALTLLVKASCTRKNILQLDVEDYKRWADRVEGGFVKAADFLGKQKIFRARDVPYQTQLGPLAAILANLGDAGNMKEAQQKIACWYWCGVFGEMYASATDTQTANDFSEVTAWIKSQGKKPMTIREATFHEKRLLEVRTRRRAVYNGVHALLIPHGCSDFRTGTPIDEKIFFDDNIDIHHIFPRVWCQNAGIESDVFNSIINKTALSARTNRKIGGRAPSEYLHRIQEETRRGNAEMDAILRSHLICPNALRTDKFWKFFKARQEALLKAIEKAMGKKVIREGDDLPDTSAQ